jgi:hypothetical protein
MPDPVQGKSATRIARLEALTTALEDALRETDGLLFNAWCLDLSAEERARTRALMSENSELRSWAKYFLGEGRPQ